MVELPASRKVRRLAHSFREVRLRRLAGLADLVQTLTGCHAFDSVHQSRRCLPDVRGESDMHGVSCPKLTRVHAGVDDPGPAEPAAAFGCGALHGSADIQIRIDGFRITPGAGSQE